MACEDFWWWRTMLEESVLLVLTHIKCGTPSWMAMLRSPMSRRPNVRVLTWSNALRFRMGAQVGEIIGCPHAAYVIEAMAIR